MLSAHCSPAPGSALYRRCFTWSSSQRQGAGTSAFPSVKWVGSCQFGLRDGSRRTQSSPQDRVRAHVPPDVLGRRGANTNLRPTEVRGEPQPLMIGSRERKNDSSCPPWNPAPSPVSPSSTHILNPLPSPHPASSRRLAHRGQKTFLKCPSEPVTFAY